MSLTLNDGITLLSGAVFNFDNPADTPVIEMTDIAIPLSNNCRFAGQLSRFYSIAQHCVNTSYIVPPEHAFSALMHDTAEAFTNDIVTPLKHKVPIFKQIEERIEFDMARRFGFEYPLSAEVKHADRQMLGLEMLHLRGQKAEDHEHLNGVEFEHLLPLVDLTSWSPRIAAYNFIERYEELHP